jgi:hypothetical protein
MTIQYCGDAYRCTGCNQCLSCTDCTCGNPVPRGLGPEMPPPPQPPTPEHPEQGEKTCGTAASIPFDFLAFPSIYREALAAARREGAKAERERCAGIAERLAVDAKESLSAWEGGRWNGLAGFYTAKRDAAVLILKAILHPDPQEP